MSNKKLHSPSRPPTRDRKVPERLRRNRKAAETPPSSTEAEPPTKRSGRYAGRQCAPSPTEMACEQTYEVGYGKPPKHTRFKKGQSGNNKGRPPGSMNFRTLLEKGLSERIAVSRGGKTQQMRLIEAILAQLTRKSASGDLAAMRYLIETTIKTGAFNEPEQVDVPDQKLSSEEKAHIDELMSWLRDHQTHSSKKGDK